MSSEERLQNGLVLSDQNKALARSKERDLSLYSPRNCFKHAHKLKSIKDVLSLPSKKLSDFRRVYGRNWTIGYISMWLIDLNDFCNAKNKMSDAQIEFTSERICDTYSLKVTDLTLFFRNVKEGKYGPFFENMSSEKVLSWLAEYFEERCEYGRTMSDSQHEKVNVNLTKMHPEIVKKMFEGVGEKEVEFEHEKSTLGYRTKSGFQRDLITEIKKKSTEELRRYLIENDVSKETYNELIFKCIEAEIDKRNRTSRDHENRGGNEEDSNLSGV